MKRAHSTVQITNPNPHRRGTQIWRAGQIVTGMEGCRLESIINALTAMEEDTRDVGVADPARWLSHFAGLESRESGKEVEPWIEILHGHRVVQSTAEFRELLRAKR